MIMTWQWNDLGAPPDQTLATSPIATASNKNNPVALVWDAHGRLWANRWDGHAGHWKDHGAAPHGHTLNQWPVATASYKNNLLTFAFGSTGHLWVNWWNGQARAWQWEDLNAPPGRTLYPWAAIATASYDGNPMAFVCDSTGHLWVNWWTGQAWKWQPQHAPNGHTLDPSAPIATASSAGNPLAFVWDTTGYLWANTWTGKTWTRKPHGAPPAQTVEPGLEGNLTAIVTASYQGSPYAFVFGPDTHLWANWLDGTAWQWKDHGTPPGPDSFDLSEIAAASCPDSPMVFTRTEDRQQTNAHVWLNQWNGSGWQWTEQGTPSGTHFPLYNVSAVSCQGTPYMFVWDDDSGGDKDPHLWVNRRSQPD